MAAFSANFFKFSDYGYRVLLFWQGKEKYIDKRIKQSSRRKSPERRQNVVKALRRAGAWLRTGERRNERGGNFPKISPRALKSLRRYARAS